MPSAANRSFIVYVLILIALIAYLFVSAPPPLPETKATGAAVPVERVFAIVEAENDIVRALWTQEIVAAGKKVGLKFDEDWREASVEAGPLPALFLRETAKSLEKHPVQLSLFLGSDFPIREANRFAGLQMEKFQRIKATREPEFFFEPSTRMHTAMFSDTAVVEACITCHNEHPQSPKNDWRLNEVMGATTWMYPASEVTLEELMQILRALRQGFREAYSAYLDKAKTFSAPPAIGERWPREGYYLPAVEVFLAEAAKHASHETLAAIHAALEPSAKPESEARRAAEAQIAAHMPTALLHLSAQ